LTFPVLSSINPDTTCLFLSLPKTSPLCKSFLLPDARFYASCHMLSAHNTKHLDFFHVFLHGWSSMQFSKSVSASQHL